MFCRLMSQLADVNIQASIGMFSFLRCFYCFKFGDGHFLFVNITYSIITLWFRYFN